MKSFYQFEARSIKGVPVSMECYQGKVVLVVNTASDCGFTPQYAGLERLYQDYKERGFVVLGFPCNQFGGQESGSNEEIAKFCDLNFRVSFPLFEKIDVNGDKAHPLFQYLKDAKPGLLGTKAIKWNFTKFLVDKSGHPVKRYGPKDIGARVEEDLKNLLDS